MHAACGSGLMDRPASPWLTAGSSASNTDAPSIR